MIYQAMKVAGFCPMGCGQKLFAADGFIRCMNETCPDPEAVHRILADDEYDHYVTFDAKGFIVKHPLRERINNALATCNAHAWIARVAYPGYKANGTYRAIRDSSGWRWAE